MFDCFKKIELLCLTINTYIFVRHQPILQEKFTISQCVVKTMSSIVENVQRKFTEYLP